MSDVLAQALLSNRERYNSRFAAARHAHPHLEGAVFAGLLRSTLAPILDAVHEAAPEACPEVLDVLYEVALDLLAQDLLGPGARYPVIASGWTGLLPRLARHLARDPWAVVTAVTNALYNLARTPGARPRQWMDDLAALSALCEEVPALLRAGQVCGWRAGMAHYRANALDLAGGLPPRIARACLGLPADSTQTVDSVIDRLRDDPWWRPDGVDGALVGAEHPGTLARPARAGRPLPRPRPRIARMGQGKHDSPLQIVARVGAFRGFGGLFIAPPRVSPAGDQFAVTDGEGTWLLAADGFGATFHRVEAAPPGGEAPQPLAAIARSGEVTAGGERRLFPELARSTSAAASRTTLAVTVPHSHAVYLVGLIKMGA